MKHFLMMTTSHIHGFYVGLNSQYVEVVKSLQSVEGAEEGMVLGFDGLELPVGCGLFAHIGIAQLSKNAPQIL